MSDLTPEMLTRIRTQAMTLQTLGGLWVTAEDYADTIVRLDDAKTRIKQLEAKLAAVRSELGILTAWPLPLAARASKDRIERPEAQLAAGGAGRARGAGAGGGGIQRGVFRRVSH